MKIKIGKKIYPVASLDHASAMFCEARDRSGEGASTIPTPSLLDDDGKVVGYISYNGRIWEGSPKTWGPQTKMLFDSGSKAIS